MSVDKTSLLRSLETLLEVPGIAMSWEDLRYQLYRLPRRALVALEYRIRSAQHLAYEDGENAELKRHWE